MRKARRDEFTQKVDPLIHKTVQGKAHTWFTKPEILRDICKEKRLANILSEANKRFPGWGIDLMIKEAIKTRLSRYLQQNMKVRRRDGEEILVRVYECYAIGQGSRRWQQLKAMTIDDLRICLMARRKQVAGHEAVIRAYERAIEEMEKTGAKKVGEVFEIAFGKELVTTEEMVVAK